MPKMMRIRQLSFEDLERLAVALEAAASASVPVCRTCSAELLPGGFFCKWGHRQYRIARRSSRNVEGGR